VSHDINADPEMWELREKFTDRAALIWLEMLSIADRNSGVVGPASDHTRNQLASKCRTSRAKVESVLGWCRVKGWLLFGQDIRVAKWAKYNKTRDVNNSPSLPSEPTKPYIKSVKKQTITPDFFLPDWLPKVEWEEFIKHRKRKRAPLTEFTAKRTIDVLRELMELGHPPADVLAEAVDRNWTGIKTEWIHKSGGFFERQKEGELSERTKRILRRGL